MWCRFFHLLAGQDPVLQLSVCQVPVQSVQDVSLHLNEHSLVEVGARARQLNQFSESWNTSTRVWPEESPTGWNVCVVDDMVAATQGLSAQPQTSQ
ncbi:hypothetical protein WICPIJ_002518 [Wickerhamomyces pijperi]|uniref:F-box domain-containing protein n=1 Tax=Wickerhamomyces pijperi TaxID=599730 RepID=A0A9P8Q9N1_WICPI|nr:hypothetical protein WICPIJ_002518 [Wickerhamomyces pijperi]